MGVYDGGRQLKADHDPTQQIQWELQGISKTIGRDTLAIILKLVEAARKESTEEITKFIQEVIKAIWVGTGGLGDLISDIFDPEAAKKAMEETQRRIAAAIAQIIAGGGTAVNFAELPPGPTLLGWQRTRLIDHGGTLAVHDGVLKIVDDVGLGGTKWRAIWTDKVPSSADVRVDAVFGTVPGLLSGASNRIIARYDPVSTDHCYVSMMGTRSDLGIIMGGRESVLKPITTIFSPAMPLSLVLKGSTLELLRDGQSIGSVFDSRLSTLTGRHVGSSFFTPLTVDPSGGLAALGFKAV
jgi:hypothetical protein